MRPVEDWGWGGCLGCGGVVGVGEEGVDVCFAFLGCEVVGGDAGGRGRGC